MQVNGTLINYYFHCKRQCYLHGNRLNLEDNSEQVKIGKAIHEERAENSKNSEIAIDNIRLDKLTKEYLTEIKKSDADAEAAKWQLLYYLSVLKSKGIVRKGKLEFVEKNKKDKKIVVLELTEESEQELEYYIKEIEKLLEEPEPPECIHKETCKKCAYYDSAPKNLIALCLYLPHRNNKSLLYSQPEYIHFSHFYENIANCSKREAGICRKK